MGFFSKLSVLFTVNSAGVTEGVNKSLSEIRRMEAEAKKAARQMEKDMEAAKAAFGKIATGAAIAGAAILAFAQHADEIADVADSLDITIGSLLELHNAAQQSGGSAEGLDKALAKLTKTADEAREGTDSAREAFTRLGISGKEVENLKPDDLYRRVALALSEVEDATTRSALAQEILGKAAKGIDWKKQAEQIADNVGKYTDGEAAIREWADAWDNLKKGVESTFVWLAKILQPIAALITHITTLGDRFRELNRDGGQLTFTNELTGEQETLDFGADAKAAAAAKNAKQTLKDRLDTPKGGYSKASKKDDAQLARELAERRRIADSLAAARKESLDFEETSRQRQRALDQQNETILLSEKEKRIKEALKGVEDDRLKAIQKINKEIETEREKEKLGGSTTPGKIAELEHQIEIINETAKAYSKSAQAAAELREQLIRIQEISDTVWKQMESALDEFINKGTFNFKKFVSSLIVELARLEAKRSLLALFSAGKSSLLEAGGGANNFSFGKLFGGSSSGAGAGTAGTDTGDVFAGLAGFAAGGTIGSNGPVVVGERGPELLYNAGGMSVASNSQSQGLGNSGPVNNYYGTYVAQVNALDSKTFEQALMQNRNSVRAAANSASRGIPSSR